jgi:hypothetical protein
VKARAGTWQVAHDCRPEADKLVSKNSALPATAAGEVTTGEGIVLPPLPPQAANVVATIHEAAAAPYLVLIRPVSCTSTALLGF